MTLIEAASLPLVGVLGPHVAEVLAGLHRDHGVHLRCDVKVEQLTGDDDAVREVALSDGSTIDADLVIVGVEHLQTSDPDVFAAGDVANAFNRSLNGYLRVEHWANAENQPAVAVQSMMGRSASYGRLPFFYSDQYDVGLEYTGYAEAGEYDRVVFRGDVESLTFTAFSMSGRRVLAGMNVNTPDVSTQIGAIIAAGLPVDVSRLADVSISLEDIRA